MVLTGEPGLREAFEGAPVGRQGLREVLQCEGEVEGAIVPHGRLAAVAQLLQHCAEAGRRMHPLCLSLRAMSDQLQV